MAEDQEAGRDDDHAGSNGGGSGLLSTLTSKELLLPAAISAVGAVAASKGPDLMRRLTDRTEERGDDEAERLGENVAEGAKRRLTDGAGGGVRGLAGKVAAKAVGKGGGGAKKTRRLPIQRWTDVAVPVEQAYEAWTAFDRYPRFMHRVLNVQSKGGDRVRWQEKIWFSTREWEGRITDRRENDRIAWKTTSGMSHRGVVTFHRLGDKLTRVMVTMEFEPSGMLEKMASGLRFVKRAVQADLARYKAYVEMEDAKGLEYRSAREHREQERGRSSGSERERHNGRNGKDDGERDAERRERETRREKRRRDHVGAG